MRDGQRAGWDNWNRRHVYYLSVYNGNSLYSGCQNLSKHSTLQIQSSNEKHRNIVNSKKKILVLNRVHDHSDLSDHPNSNTMYTKYLRNTKTRTKWHQNHERNKCRKWITKMLYSYILAFRMRLIGDLSSLYASRSIINTISSKMLTAKPKKGNLSQTWYDSTNSEPETSSLW